LAAILLKQEIIAALQRKSKHHSMLLTEHRFFGNE
jgi:hypothetical protein